jgi:small subunit ribosomal protein S7
MPPPLRLLQAGRSIAIRSRGSRPTSYPIPLCLRLPQKRTITADEKPLPEAEQNPGPNQEQLPHVSEEAATTARITGEGGPEIEQGTPVQEVRW